MLPGPVLRRELRVVGRPRDLLGVRTGLATALVVFLVVLARYSQTSSAAAASPNVPLLIEAGVMAVAYLALFVSFLIVIGEVGGAIAEERAKNRLEEILMTALTPADLVLAKLIGRLPGVLTPVLVALPVLVLLAGLASVPAARAGLIAAALVSSCITMAALSLLASARSAKVDAAQVWGCILIMAWSVVLPMAAFVPVGGTGVVIDLLRTLKAACLWVIPSSPLWPLFQALLTGGPLGATLDHQLTAMIATQAGVTVVALVGAALCLGTRVRPEGGFDPADPYRGYRPACGDDPIVWREYALPTRAGRHWFPAFARYLFALLRHGAALLGQFLRTVLAASAVTIALSIPIGLAVAGAWYGYPAFLENWRFGGDPSAPFVARMALYRFVTYTSFMILSPILVAAVSLPAEYQVEQTRGTWTLLLTTPLSGAEIVRSKMRAKWLALRTLGWALGVLSLLALVCGVIHPLGLVYALTSLALAVWAALAAGTWFALREGSEWSLRRAGAPLGAVVLIVLEAGFCVPALFPSREVSLAIAQYPLQVGLAAAGGLAVSALTGLFAWSITWTVIARFDGWVGRPRRAPGETDAIDAAVVAVSPEPAREVA